MAFTSYKSIADVQEKFNIKHIEQSFIIANPTIPSPEFLEDLAFVQENMDIFTSEAARCEAVIFPVLKDIYKRHFQYLSLWIKKHIAFDADLQGEPDYLLATKSELGKKVLAKPLLAVVEAKKNVHWAQPTDINFAERKLDTELGGYHDEGFNLTMCDGSARFVSKQIDPEILKLLIMGRDGQAIDHSRLK